MTEKEFKETVLPLHAAMLEEAMRLLRNRDEALDCLQDAVTALWKSRKALANVGNIKAYCIRSVANRALEMIRRRRLPYSDYDGDLPADDNAASAIERSEKAALLKEAIRMLPENERKVVVMKAIDGMTSDEIAEATGFSSGNVRVLLHRGRKRIREHLNKNDGI